MLNWNPSYNWTYAEFDSVVTEAFDVEKKQSVSLDVEHSDWRNMEAIKKWAQEKCYKAIEVNSDIIRIER